MRRRARVSLAAVAVCVPVALYAGTALPAAAAETPIYRAFRNGCGSPWAATAVGAFVVLVG